MQTTDGNVGVYRLATEEARRGLDGQEGILGGLRTRSVALVSAGSIVAAFLGPARSQESAIALVVASYVAFTAVVVAAVVILASTRRREMRFVLDPAAIIGWTEDDDPSLGEAEATREIALQLGEIWEKNEKALRWRHWILNGAVAALLVQTLLMLAATL